MPRTSTSWPLVMPPSRPPARLAPRVNLRALRDRNGWCPAPSNRSWPRLPRRIRPPRPSPPAWKRWPAPGVPSSRESQVMCEPRPGGHAVRHHFEDAAHGVAGAIGLVHHRLHALLRLRHRRSPAALRPCWLSATNLFPVRGALQPLGADARSRGSASAMPNSPRNALASAPTATRAVVSRALARSRM